jgi:hypothetical protein
MKKYVIVFILGIVVGSGSYWTLRDGPLASKLRDNALVEKVTGKVDEFATDRLKAAMEKDGKIVRNKPAGLSIPKVEDGLLKDLVKAKIAAEPLLSDASIKADVKEGEVSLEGSAASYEQVARAMRLAFECDATKTVVSTIQVKSK